MNSLPSDNRQMVNAFLVKSHKSFGLLGNVHYRAKIHILYFQNLLRHIEEPTSLANPSLHIHKKYYCFRKGQTNPRRRFSHSGRRLTSSPLLTVMTLWCLWLRITATHHPPTRQNLTLPSHPQNTSATSARST